MKQVGFGLLLLLAGTYALGQDSAQVLSYETYMEQVMTHHPVVFRAEIVRTSARAELKQSKGAVDPKWFGNTTGKQFEGTNYYHHLKSGLKIPSWFGISAELGYQSGDGTYLNPENRLPDAGVWYGGLRLELGKGLIIDQRRAVFEKAKQIVKQSEYEQKIMRNELRLNASNAYWKWLQSYRLMNVYEQAFKNASERYDAVKQAAAFGDRPYIDTVEAGAIRNQRYISLMQASATFANAQLNMQLYLWEEGVVPLEIDGLIPGLDTEEPAAIKMFIDDTLFTQHPYLKIGALSIAQREIDLALKKEQLKPQLTLAYNVLAAPVTGGTLPETTMENYSFGASMSYPLFTRKERGGVALSELKLKDQELKNALLQAELKYKAGVALNNLKLNAEQVQLHFGVMLNYEQLYEAERTLFTLGESAVFMINSRESSWLKARVDYIKAQGEYRMSEAQYRFTLQLDD